MIDIVTRKGRRTTLTKKIIRPQKDLGSQYSENIVKEHAQLFVICCFVPYKYPFQIRNVRFYLTNLFSGNLKKAVQKMNKKTSLELEP